MDVPTLMHNLREEVTCSVCIHLYKEPKQLPCLHIFCLACLNDLVRTNARQGKIKCPLCQTEIVVPDSGTMETLPDCFYLKNMLDILAIKECNTSKVTCRNCDDKSEEASYCFHCSKFWCKECLIGHDILRENKEHRVIALKDFQDKDFEDVLKRPAFCPKELHERKVFKFYCKLCQVPACKNCVTLEHGKHDVEHLEITARAVRSDITAKLETTKKSCQRASSIVRDLEEESRLAEHHWQLVKRKIQETVKSTIMTLQQQERILITEVENQAKEAQEYFTKHKAKFQDQVKESEEKVSKVTSLLQRSTGAELVGTRTFVDGLFEELPQSQEMPLTSDGKPVTTVFFKHQEICARLQEENLGHLAESTTDVNHCSVEEFKEAIGGLQTYFEVITRNSEGELRYCPGDCIAVEIMSAQSGKAAAAINVEDKTDGNYRVSYTPSIPGQHNVTVQINGEKIKQIPPVYVKERSFKHVRCIDGVIGNKHFKPWGVTVNSCTNELFLTDLKNNRILVFNEKGEFIRSLGQTDLLNEPTGISIDNEGRIFVANRGDNKILLITPNGERAIVVNDGLLKEPRGISLDSQGNIIVCDSGNKCVKIFSSEGHTLNTVGKGRLHKPVSCLCYADKIFVSDHGAHLIKVYSSKGRFLYEFGRHGTADGELNSPAGLAVDKAGHLLVCSGGNHRIQVFTLDGKFVAKFGSFGIKYGEFSIPSSASVLESGHIVVCDLVNDRLQIFE